LKINIHQNLSGAVPFFRLIAAAKMINSIPAYLAPSFFEAVAGEQCGGKLHCLKPNACKQKDVDERTEFRLQLFVTLPGKE
jgi:hypothetical protein